MPSRVSQALPSSRVLVLWLEQREPLSELPAMAPESWREKQMQVAWFRQLAALQVRQVIEALLLPPEP